ncbi:MAG: Calx-beta domain-containing protein [Xenococcaceae cyanobacterium MO_207.B15]|nr:Calx-beta domain-containing protein [Xenococcaceae cyanobacterium MO_207.B15]
MTIQQIQLSANETNVVSGEQIPVTVTYDVENGDNTLTGVGFRIHFDSTKLQLGDINTDFSTGLFGTVAAIADDSDQDSDESTNRQINWQYVDFVGNWPNVELPLVLGTLNFTTLDNFSDTQLNVTFSETASGFTEEADSLSLTLDETPPSLPSLSINNVSLEEGNEDNTEFSFTVSLSEASTETVTVDYATADDSAIAGQDYIATNGTLTFEPGVREQTLIVQITGDTEVEEDENFSVNLSNASGATISENQGTATITNDDFAPEPTLSIDDISLAEGNDGNTNFTFTVSLSEASDETITVDYATEDDSAIAGQDYIANNGTLTFEPGETEQTISVLVEGDINFEADETFSVRLSNSSENAEIEDSEGIGTINNDDQELETIELFRFRNTTFSTGTYIFVGEAERDAILANPDFNQTFELDGVNPDGSVNPAFTASTQPGDDLEGFFRLSSLDNPGTFLFVGQGEYDAIFAEGSDQRDRWEPQGFDADGNDIPEFYLYGVGAGLGTPFNRFQNRANNTFLFAGPEETAAINSDPNFSAAFLDQGGAFESII